MLQYFRIGRCFVAAMIVVVIIAHHTLAFDFNLISPLSRRRAFLREGGTMVIGLFGASQSSFAKNLPSTMTTDYSKTGTVEALVPILQLLSNLRNLKSELLTDLATTLTKPIVASVPLDEQSFKRLFDTYSDPVSYKQKFLDQNAFLVYYSRGFDGPGRPSIESDLPVKQTIQYGSRNEAWISWEDFQAEWTFACRNPADADLEDLLKPLGQTIAAVESYLEQAPAADVQKSWKRVWAGAAK